MLNRVPQAPFGEIVRRTQRRRRSISDHLRAVEVITRVLAGSSRRKLSAQALQGKLSSEDCAAPTAICSPPESPALRVRADPNSFDSPSTPASRREWRLEHGLHCWQPEPGPGASRNHVREPMVREVLAEFPSPCATNASMIAMIASLRLVFSRRRVDQNRQYWSPTIEEGRRRQVVPDLLGPDLSRIERAQQRPGQLAVTILDTPFPDVV